MEPNNSFTLLDKYQIPVVEASHGYHLVLASPGCGKTHILAERIRYAKERGVRYEDMLCLTFTNRAAREMTNRIQKVVGGDSTELMVGMCIGSALSSFSRKTRFQQTPLLLTMRKP